MNLELLITKKKYTRAAGSRELVTFAVVDLDKATIYPNNFVCILPKIIRDSKFFEIFRENSTQVALSLLTAALTKQDNSQVSAEIEHRVKLLKVNQKIEDAS